MGINLDAVESRRDSPRAQRLNAPMVSSLPRLRHSRFYDIASDKFAPHTSGIEIPEALDLTSAVVLIHSAPLPSSPPIAISRLHFGECCTAVGMHACGALWNLIWR